MQVGIQVLSTFPTENRREFIRSFDILPPFDGYSENCSFCRLFEDVAGLNSFLWVEYWLNEEAMDKYLQSDRFKTILGAIETLGELVHSQKIQSEDCTMLDETNRITDAKIKI